MDAAARSLSTVAVAAHRVDGRQYAIGSSEVPVSWGESVDTHVRASLVVVVNEFNRALQRMLTAVKLNDVP